MTSAASFLDQIPSLWFTESTSWIRELRITASPRVVSEMRRVDSLDLLDGVCLNVREDRPQLLPNLARRSGLDVRFTLRGPEYQGRRADIEVVGFADGAMLPARSDISLTHGTIRPQDWVNALVRRKKLSLLEKYDAFIVQTDDMASALRRVAHHQPIKVVPNVVSEFFRNEKLQEKVVLPPRLPEETRLFYPARGYLHKNHRFIPSTVACFERLFNKPLRIVITLRKDELTPLVNDDTYGLLNIGEVTASECPDIYRQTDGLFFPSLNETFSASPIEASFMDRPVVATGLPFMVEMTKGHATYFELGNSADAARAIYEATSRREASETTRAAALRWAQSLPTPIEQARLYVNFLHEQVLSQGS